MTTLVDPALRVAVLGPVLVRGPQGGALVEPPSARGKALVATLALASGDSVSVPRLIDELWGDTPPRAGKAALQTLVSRLRQTCADEVIVSTAGGYALGDGEASDLAVASAALRRAHRLSTADPSAVVPLATDALGLWRGEPGADLADSDSADELAASAERLRVDLLRVRARAHYDLGDHAAALLDLDALGAAALRDDELLALRLQSLDGLGRRTDALRVFADYRERLADELGTDPSPELVRLHTELLQDPAPQATVTRLAIGVRQAPNALIGRAADLERIDALFAESRLVTILGPGGLGKTRLAQEVAGRSVASTPGVVVVELAGVRADDDVTLALATTLGIREAKVGRIRLTDPAVRVDVRELILAALAERPTLLVVDNCEHVIEAAASWIADILGSTTTVRVLATSRSPLAIGAERVLPLESLGSVPGVGADNAAVQLFRERARAARPGVALPDEVVARLCARLDGLPLAIELAAARVRSMSVDEIERRLGNRFALLTGGDRSAPERHRTLTAVIDWSWNLLGTSERTLLRRLSRFPDGFGAEAAEVVGGDDGDVVDALDGLVTQSLVAVTDDPDTGALRYRMLETVREFGDRELVRAGEESLVDEAMFRWAGAFCAELVARLDGPDQLAAIHAIAAEQDNLATVLRRAMVEERPADAVTIFAALGYFWTLRGNQSDVSSFGSAVLGVIRRYEPDAAHLPATAMTLALAGSMGLFMDHRMGLPAISRLRKLRASGARLPSRLQAMIDIMLAAVRGMDAVRDELPRVARSSDPVIAEIGTILYAQTLENQGLVTKALVLTEEAHASAKSNGHVWAAATSASFLAQLHAQTGDPEGALRWAFTARDGLEAIGARSDLQELRRRIAAAEVALGRFDNARAIFDGILSGDEEIPATEREDVRLIAALGLAEIAYREGRTTDSLARYDAAVADVLRSRGPLDLRRWPQVILSSSAAIAAHAVFEDAPRDAAATDALATSLRTRLLAMRRLQTRFDDIPMAGAATFALGAWLLWPARRAAAETRSRGLRLVLLAQAMNPRQEFGSLELAPVTSTLDDRFASAELAEARSAVAGLSPAEALNSAYETLGDRRLRRPFDGV